ncbi:MAG: formyltransferase family protein [Candidatus Gracilibacteria bacterium]
MRIFLLANNWVGREVCRFLKENNESIVGLAIHPLEIQKFTDEIVEISGLPRDVIFEAPQLMEPSVFRKIQNLNADIGIAAYWGTILTPDFFNLFPNGCINFHSAYLPYNRGKNPNVWPFVEGTPGGACIHYIDKGIDSGDIIAREKIPIEPIDTAGTFDKKGYNVLLELFKKNWPLIKSGKNPRLSQKGLPSSFHLGKQVDTLDPIDLDKTYTGREFLNRLRARNYSGRTFSYFEENGKRVYIHLDLSYDSKRNSGLRRDVLFAIRLEMRPFYIKLAYLNGASILRFMLLEENGMACIIK